MVQATPPAWPSFAIGATWEPGPCQRQGASRQAGALHARRLILA
jgi:hypothetical protein